MTSTRYRAIAHDFGFQVWDGKREAWCPYTWAARETTACRLADTLNRCYAEMMALYIR